MPSLSRRRLLGLTALGFSTGLAGCNQSAATPHNTATTTRQPTATTTTHDGRAGPAPSCTGEYSSFNPSWVVEGSGPLGGFTLRATPASLALGEGLTVKLRNTTVQRQMSGTKGKFDIQYQSEDGWHTIFGPAIGPGWLDKGVSHYPSQGFTWEFPFTRDGLSGLTTQYHTCSPLDPGTYRFVYWGITSEQEKDEGFGTDYALGAPFTVTDD